MRPVGHVGVYAERNPHPPSEVHSGAALFGHPARRDQHLRFQLLTTCGLQQSPQSRQAHAAERRLSRRAEVADHVTGDVIEPAAEDGRGAVTRFGSGAARRLTARAGRNAGGPAQWTIYY